MNDFKIYAIVLGFLLDLIIGDPYKMPHPIKLYGHTIYWLEAKLNKGRLRKLKGAIVAIGLILLTFAVFYAVKYVSMSNTYVLFFVTSVFVFYGLANRTLIKEVLKVNKRLHEEGLEAGRDQLKYIVGRETKTLSEHEIRKASLETLAENLSDGVIAPMFYLFIGGFPLMMAYKMVNTLDSMIGYKSERYKDFGCWAAHIDDVFNYVPARITAFLMAVVSLKLRPFRFIVQYGRKHSSPNAGYPESALAGILNCQFGGPATYYGELVNKPFIGNNKLTFESKHVLYACGINLKTSILFLILGIGIKILFNIF